jgi:hypothetical protein
MNDLQLADLALASGNPQEARTHAARGFAAIRAERSRQEAAPALRAIREESDRIKSALAVLPRDSAKAIGYRATLRILEQRKAAIVAELAEGL